MNQIKKYKWQITAGLISAAEVITGIIAIVQICLLKMLPAIYIGLTTFAFAVLWIGTIVLMLFKSRKKNWNYARRTIGAIIGVLVIIISIVAVGMLGKLNSTLSNFDGEVEVSDVIGVYVLADNEANSIRKAKDYKFAVSTFFDYENTKTTIEAINKKTKTEISVVEMENVVDIVDALKNGEVDAIILNTAYVPVLEDQKKYKTFSQDTKVIYTYEIIEEVDEAANEEKKDLGPVSERPFIVYISGNDGLYSKLSTSRSDVNLLAVVNPTTKQILLLNTPRDYYVLTEEANFTQYDKLTHCGLYGPDCSMATLGNLYDCDIEFYTQINFTGFSALVDSIGGVTVDVDKSFTSVDGIPFSKGVQTLYGEKALAFARERQAFSSGDLQRGKNQMKLVKAIIEKAKSSEKLLTNYSEVLDSLEGMFVTNVSSDEMAELVKMQLSDGGDWNIVSYAVSGKGSKQTTYTDPSKKRYVMYQSESDVATAKALIKQVYDGETISEVTTEE